MLEDLDLLTDEPSAQAVDDLRSLRDELAKALKEVDELKVEKTRVEVENRDLQSKLEDAERTNEKEQTKVKQFEKEVSSLRKQLEEYKSEKAQTKDQSKEDAVRQKETFTEVKKQLFKQLMQEKEKSKQLETELIDLKKKMDNPATLSPNKASSALRALGFFGKSDVDEKASEDSSNKAGDSSLLVAKISPQRQTLPSAPEKSAPTSKVVSESRDKSPESTPLGDNYDRIEFEAKKQECQDLRDEIKRLEDRLANISTSYDQLLTETDEIRFSKDETETKLNNTQGDFQELKNQSVRYLEDIQSLKAQLASTSSQTRQTVLDLNHKLEMAATANQEALLRKDKNIESLKIERMQEIASLKDDHEKTNIAHAQTTEMLSNELQILRSRAVQQGLELEKMSQMVANYKVTISDTNEKENVLEQRKKCLEKEKKLLIKEVVKLRENKGVFDTKLNSEKEVREQLENKITHLQEDHIKLSKEVQTIEEDRVKYKTLYGKVVQEREAAVDFHESTMKELKTKLKAVLDIGQGILMTIENMTLEKLRCSTPGMKDVQRLQWANTEIQKSIMPTVRKQMSGEQEPDSTTRFTKSVLSNMLLTLCQTLLHSNIILLKVAEA